MRRDRHHTRGLAGATSIVFSRDQRTVVSLPAVFGNSDNENHSNLGAAGSMEGALSRLYSIALVATVLVLFAVAAARAADRKYSPGVTDSEIIIGQTMPYSGILSAAGTIGRTELAFFKMINEQGGVNGRKIRLISLDDGYTPPKTVEGVRRLVEQENAFAIFNIIGTPTAASVQRYLNERKVPEVFLQSGASRFADPEHYPWTMSLSPSYRAEAEIYAKYVLETKPGAKVAVLFQDDDFGKDYLGGFKDGLGDRAAAMIVAEASYETSDPTVDSQVVSLQASGADVLINGATFKFAAQAIRRAYDIGWKPMHFLNGPATSIPSTLRPAGLEKAVGLITARSSKTPGDPQWEHDPDYQKYLAFMRDHYPGGDAEDSTNFAGYAWAYGFTEVLRRCGDNLTRENLMYQLTHLSGFRTPILLPGVTIETSPTDYRPIKQFFMHRFDGAQWVLFGDILRVSSAK
jgi:branched-chain amino acid transport system substrate-binding protein